MENNVTTIGFMDEGNWVFVETNSLYFVTYLESLGHTEKITKDYGELGILYYFRIEKKYLGEIFTHAESHTISPESGTHNNAGGDAGESQEGGDKIL